MTKTRAILAVAVVTAAVFYAARSEAFVLFGYRWPNATTSFYVSIPGADGLWNSSFEAAMFEWNSRTAFRFSVARNEYADPCNSQDGRNGVAFMTTQCGTAFGATTLAAASIFTRGGIPYDSGIVFNSSYSWNVYSGPSRNEVKDFRRVAVHELGHVLGLDHELVLSAIMNPFISDREVPQVDDIDGVDALYGKGGMPDTTPPVLTVSSHTNGQTVSSSPITLSGTATDSGTGNSGIFSVTVNGIAANGGSASGSDSALWSRSLTLNPGANTIAVAAIDNSPNRNTTTRTITINLTIPVGPSPTASTYHIFPQFADGRLSDGSFYRTTLMISNPSASSAATCSLQLHGLSLSGFSLTYSMLPSGWVIAPTSGVNNFQSGYATLQCSEMVEAQLLYSLYSRTGIKVSEATVFSSPAAATVQILGDTREGARVGLAIANDLSQSVSYTVLAADLNGATVGTTTLTLQAKSSRAAFVDELINVPANNYGQVIVSSTSGTGSIIGLRFSGSAFTTIPETIRSVIGTTASTYHIFPQFADGRLSDGSFYRTTLMISNPSASIGATCSLQLFGLSLSGLSLTYSMLPSGWVIAPTTGVNNFQSGYATLQCSERVEAQLLYSLYSRTGIKVSEATVFSSPAAATVQILGDTREGARIGLAIANDLNQSVSYAILAANMNGVTVGTTTLTLPAKSARAAFVDELMIVPANNYGQVIVSSTSGTGSIIGLRFTGSAFTTIPETIR